MAIDFVPIQAQQSAPASPSIDFQPMVPSDIPADSTAGKIASNIGGDSAFGQAINNVASNPFIKANTTAVNAIGSGAIKGALNAVGDMGSLAASIMAPIAGSSNMAALKDAATAKYQKFKNYVNNDNIGDLARQEDPAIAAVAQGAGYIAANSGLSSLALKPAQALVNPVLKSLLPSMQGGVVASAAEQSALGGVMGAASNPDNPVQGALWGALAGTVLGGITGYIGGRVRQAGTIIEREQNLAKQAGLPLNSPGVINRTKSELSSRGLDMTKDSVRDAAQQNVVDQINKIRPDGAINQSPTQTIIDQGSKSWNEVKPISDANYAPLKAATGTAQATNTKAALEQVEKDLPNLGLPKKALPDDASLSDMITYKRKLGNLENAAYRQVRIGNLSMDDAKLYTDLGAAINKDIASLADQQGLTGQLQKANQYWQQNVLPFQAFNKGGIAMDPAKAKTAFKIISTQLKARNPDIERIGNIARAIGPDGQRVTGYATIENVYQRSFNAEGEFDSGKFANFSRKLHETGVDTKLLTPEHLAMLNGLRKTAEATTKILKQTAPPILPGLAGAVQQKIQELAHSEAGIALLRTIGGSGTKAQVARDLMQKLITGTYIHLKSKETNSGLNP